MNFTEEERKRMIYLFVRIHKDTGDLIKIMTKYPLQLKKPFFQRIIEKFKNLFKS